MLPCLPLDPPMWCGASDPASRWQLPGQPSLDWPSFLAKKNAELQRLNGVYMNLLNNSGVEVRRWVERLGGWVGGEGVTGAVGRCVRA